MRVNHVPYDACRSLGLVIVETVLAYTIDAASELRSRSTAPNGKAGPQAAHKTSKAAASSADDAQSMNSTPAGATTAHPPGVCVMAHAAQQPATAYFLPLAMH